MLNFWFINLGGVFVQVTYKCIITQMPISNLYTYIIEVDSSGTLLFFLQNAVLSLNTTTINWFYVLFKLSKNGCG